MTTLKIAEELGIKNTLCEWDDFEKDLFDLENDIKNKKKVTTPWQGLSLFESPAIQLKNTILFSEHQKENSFCGNDHLALLPNRTSLYLASKECKNHR